MSTSDRYATETIKHLKDDGFITMFLPNSMEQTIQVLLYAIRELNERLEAVEKRAVEGARK